MSSINEIVERIAVANAESRRINEERNINIGKRETLTKQLNTAIEKYKNDYGVSLTAETLEAEVTRVIQAKEAEVKNIETMLSLIKEGRYVEAEQIVNPQPQVEASVSTPEPVTMPTPEPIAMPSPVAPEPAPVSMPNPVMPAPAPAPMPSPVAPVSPVMSEPVAPSPVAPVTPVAPSPVAPPPVNTSGIAALNGFSAPQQEAPVAPPEPIPAPPTSPVTPSAPMSPTSPTMENVTSFSAILGGSSFQL